MKKRFQIYFLSLLTLLSSSSTFGQIPVIQTPQPVNTDCTKLSDTEPKEACKYVRTRQTSNGAKGLTRIKVQIANLQEDEL